MRNLQTMCESVQKLPQEWKAVHPDLEWEKIAGFRNVLTQDYLDIDLDIVWNVIERYLPDLEKTIEAIAEEFW